MGLTFLYLFVGVFWVMTISTKQKHLVAEFVTFLFHLVCWPLSMMIYAWRNR